jgi:hypothetical protein
MAQAQAQAPAAAAAAAAAPAVLHGLLQLQPTQRPRTDAEVLTCFQAAALASLLALLLLELPGGA